MQNVVQAVPDPPDETGERVLEACTQRLQALTNLRTIVAASGGDSEVAAAASDAVTESARLGLVTRLFGEQVAAHWIPRLTTDVLFAADPAVDADPEAVLRDDGGRWTPSQRRRALFMLLARAPLGEEERTWLSEVIEEFLQ
jgi:hypothetical protein